MSFAICPQHCLLRRQRSFPCHEVRCSMLLRCSAFASPHLMFDQAVGAPRRAVVATWRKYEQPKSYSTHTITLQSDPIPEFSWTGSQRFPFFSLRARKSGEDASMRSLFVMTDATILRPYLTDFFFGGSSHERSEVTGPF